MKLKQMTQEEIELLSYTDLTYILLSENKKSMNTPTIFRKISDLLGYSDDEYASKIGDYYTSLTIDKRFVWLDNNEWDVRDRHSISLIVDEEDEDEEIILEDEIEEDIEEEEVETAESDIDALNEDETLDDDDDDMNDLTIINEDDEEEES